LLLIVGHILSWDSVGNPRAFKEKCLNEFHNQFLIEKLIENFLGFGTLQRNRHEGEFKHSVFGLILTLTSLDLVEGRIENSRLFAVVSAHWNVSGAKSDQGTHVQRDG